MNKKIQDARNFAIEKHADQKYGDLPYIFHLDMVYGIAKDAGLDEDYLVACYLHDCLEDTNTTKEEIEAKFNVRVAAMVYSVSGEGSTRKERKLSMLKKLQEFPEGIELKMVDRLANMEYSKKTNQKLFMMYEKELADYKNLFENRNVALWARFENLVKPKKCKPI